MNELEELKNKGTSTIEREKEKEQKPFRSLKGNLSAEPEIECPRCHEVMILQSEFDQLFYFCEQCCFSLSLIQ
jgi:predicted  nucleic acid-binding Zn ribbon protein